jgi:hypothetical protein
MTDAGRPARSVAASAVVAALSSALAAGEPPLEVDVPSVPAPASGSGSPAVVDAVLGTFTTSFTCCEPRVTNIRLIAATVDGTVVQPGEQLSLNGLVGPRTRAKGYVEAPFISGGMLSTDVGGGVSQFATTMFNAAFFAGVQLDDFRAHSFYISRYPPGREATINYPSIDLAWTNDTDTPLLVRTVTTGTSVTVALYGRDDGRTVTGTTETAERARAAGSPLASAAPSRSPAATRRWRPSRPATTRRPGERRSRHEAATDGHEHEPALRDRSPSPTTSWPSRRETATDSGTLPAAGEPVRDRLGPAERAFLAERDGSTWRASVRRAGRTCSTAAGRPASCRCLTTRPWAGATSAATCSTSPPATSPATTGWPCSSWTTPSSAD